MCGQIIQIFDRIREIMSLRREFGNLDLLIYTPEELEGMLSVPTGVRESD